MDHAWLRTGSRRSHLSAAEAAGAAGARPQVRLLEVQVPHDVRQHHLQDHEVHPLLEILEDVQHVGLQLVQRLACRSGLVEAPQRRKLQAKP